MAKKRKNQKRKHNQNNHQSDFLADIPESTEQSEWSPSMDIQSSPQSGGNLHDEPTSQEEINVSQEGLQQEEAQQEHQEINQEAQGPSTQQDQVAAPLLEGQEEQVSEQDEDGVILGHTIGPHLKKERERLGIQLKNVVQSTKISLTNLENLEVDNLDALPDKAYVTGYVKSYSKLLNLNTDEALKLLDYTYDKLGKTQRPQEIVIPQAQNAPQVSMPLPWAKIGMAAAAIVLIIAIGAGAWMLFSSLKEESQQDTTQVELEQKSTDITPQSLSADTPLQDELPEGTPNVEPQMDEAQREQQNEQSATVSQEVKVKVEEEKKVAETQKKEEEAPKKEEKEIKFYGMSRNLYDFDQEMSQEKIDELLPTRFRVTPTEDIYAVYVTASKGDSWLTYKSDDEEVRKFVLKQGRSILIRGKITRLFLGNLGAVNVFLNNRPLKIKSPSGVKSLIFPEEKSGDYVTPLFIYKKDGSVITSEEYLLEQTQ